MRFAIATLIFGVTLSGSADATSPKSACKSRTSSMYNYCMKNARTKQMKKACKADYKRNKGQCK